MLIPPDHLGVDHLSVLGMPPVEFVELAAEAGCTAVSLLAEQLTINPYAFPDWSLRSDAPLRRRVRERLDGLGLDLALGEGCSIASDRDVKTCLPLIAMFKELGAKRLNLISYEHDLARDFEQSCAFAELADEFQMQVCLEFSARAGRPKLDAFLDRIKKMGRANVTALIDVMHFFRAGQSVGDLNGRDPALFSHLQLCDAPLRGQGDYMEEALYRRMVPGEGELDVVALIAALPADIAISMEIPQSGQARPSISHLERLRYAAGQCRAAIAKARRNAPMTGEAHALSGRE